MKPVLGFRLRALPATTVFVAASPLAGGTRKRDTGYAIAAAAETNPAAGCARRTVRRARGAAPPAIGMSFDGVRSTSASLTGTAVRSFAGNSATGACAILDTCYGWHGVSYHTCFPEE